MAALVRRVRLQGGDVLLLGVRHGLLDSEVVHRFLDCLPCAAVVETGFSPAHSSQTLTLAHPQTHNASSVLSRAAFSLLRLGVGPLSNHMLLPLLMRRCGASTAGGLPAGSASSSTEVCIRSACSLLHIPVVFGDRPKHLTRASLLRGTTLAQADEGVHSLAPDAAWREAVVRQRDEVLAFSLQQTLASAVATSTASTTLRIYEAGEASGRGRPTIAGVMGEMHVPGVASLLERCDAHELVERASILLDPAVEPADVPGSSSCRTMKGGGDPLFNACQAAVWDASRVFGSVLAPSSGSSVHSADSTDSSKPALDTAALDLIYRRVLSAYSADIMLLAVNPEVHIARERAVAADDREGSPRPKDCGYKVKGPPTASSNYKHASVVPPQLHELVELRQRFVHAVSDRTADHQARLASITALCEFVEHHRSKCNF